MGGSIGIIGFCDVGELGDSTGMKLRGANRIAEIFETKGEPMGGNKLGMFPEGYLCHRDI